MGIVYFLRAENKDLFKVGITRNDVDKRIGSIQTTCPYELHLYGSVESPAYQAIEREIHQEWKDRRRRGEWFTVGADDVNEMIRRYGGGQSPPLVMLDTDRAEYAYDPESGTLYIRVADVAKRNKLYAIGLLSLNSTVYIGGLPYADFSVLMEEWGADDEDRAWREKIVSIAQSHIAVNWSLA